MLYESRKTDEAIKNHQAASPSGNTRGRAIASLVQPVAAFVTLLALFLGFFGAHRFYMGAWGWGLVQLLAVPLVIGILMALLPPLGGLMYVAAIGFVVVESVRYIWMSDAEFDAKVRAYQATQPGPFAFFW